MKNRLEAVFSFFRFYFYFDVGNVGSLGTTLNATDVLVVIANSTKPVCPVEATDTRAHHHHAEEHNNLITLITAASISRLDEGSRIVAEALLLTEAAGTGVGSGGRHLGME